MNKCFTLALSGGGYKGLFSAHILAELEKQFGCPIAQKFDLIAGTSIGGIIALALALEIPAEDIEKMFLENGKIIFKKRFFLSNGLFFKSKYAREGLYSVLEKIFGDKKISELKHRVLITSVNYTDGKPQMFKTPHHDMLIKDANMRIIDVAMNTSAAPMFFPINSIDEEGDFVDGGLVGNHPGFFAMFEAEKYLNQNTEDIYQLHIGTISQKFTSSSSKYVLASSFFSWRQKLFNLLFSCQEQSTNFLLRKYLGDRYYSIDSLAVENQAKKIALDKVSKTSSRILKQKGSEAVKNYLGSSHYKLLMEYKAQEFTKGSIL